MYITLIFWCFVSFKSERAWTNACNWKQAAKSYRSSYKCVPSGGRHWETCEKSHERYKTDESAQKSTTTQTKTMNKTRRRGRKKIVTFIVISKIYMIFHPARAMSPLISCFIYFSCVQECGKFYGKQSCLVVDVRSKMMRLEADRLRLWNDSIWFHSSDILMLPGFRRYKPLFASFIFKPHFRIWLFQRMSNQKTHRMLNR